MAAKRRTPAQRAATKRLIAHNKSHKKRVGFKKGPRGKKIRRLYSATPRPRGMVGMNGKPVSAAKMKKQFAAMAHAMGPMAYAVQGVAASKAYRKKKRRKAPKARKATVHHISSYKSAARMGKTHKKSKTRKGTPVLTAAAILKGARANRTKVWLCGGKKYTGCGGGMKGRKGSRVVGHLR